MITLKAIEMDYIIFSFKNSQRLSQKQLKSVVQNIYKINMRVFQSAVNKAIAMYLGGACTSASNVQRISRPILLNFRRNLWSIYSLETSVEISINSYVPECGISR